MKIIIIGDFSFPLGMAATSRVSSYAQGLMRCGVNVKLLCLPSAAEPRRGPHLNTAPHGVYEGIEFAYVSGATSPPPSFLRRRWLELMRPWLFFSGLRREANIGEADALILYSEAPLNMILAFIFARWRGIKYVQELCEIPLIYERNSLFARLSAKLIFHWLYLLPDLVICISSCLRQYIGGQVRKDAKLIEIPVLVDFEHFSTPAATRPGPTYIAYAGALRPSKGVDILIRAFALVAPDFSDLQLKISGDTRHVPDYVDQLKALIHSLELDDRVLLLGLLPQEAFEQVLQGAAALVMPHRKGDFSSAALPTKLGEYLATGIPVIASRVGEVERYLSDGVEALLVPPDDPRALAGKLRFVLENPSAAHLIGIRGMARAKDRFDCSGQMQRFVEFLCVRAS